MTRRFGGCGYAGGFGLGIAYWEAPPCSYGLLRAGTAQALVAGALGDYHVQVFRISRGSALFVSAGTGKHV